MGCDCELRVSAGVAGVARRGTPRSGSAKGARGQSLASVRAAAMLPVYLLLCLGLASANKAFITEFTVPKAAKVGDDVELKCEYKLVEPESQLFYVKWWWTPLDSSERHNIYQRLGHHASQTSHEGLKIKDNDTIELVDVDPTDSGVYECEVSNIDEDRRRQEFIVYTPGTGPLLNASVVGDGPDNRNLVIKCEAFDVAPEPEFRITVGSQEVEVREVDVTGPIDGFYSIAANVTLEEGMAEGSTITCEMLYKNNDVNHLPYISTISYEGSGAELATTDLPEDTTQWETTTEPADGSRTALSDGLLVLATAALVQIFTRH